ncbi:MAG: transglycosylase SLT domain-containing protein [Deltaproteobacteria bacterium]|nr:transglycosylase SLT domain-containing protein [Deltaproteobacteria bacterium]
MDASWRKFSCPGSVKSWRYLTDGRIQLQDEGVVSSPWPERVNDWRQLIEASALVNEVPAAWVAAIMAKETGGRNVCLDADALPGYKACSAPCRCVQNEGAGLMATLPATASSMMGQAITSQQLLGDPALAIEAGTRYLSYQLNRYGGDFVQAAVAYNAGSVKCGRGSTFRPAGTSWPKEPCPDLGWGVVFGCVYANAKYGERCVPSSTGVKSYVCSTDYPRQAIHLQNAAREHFEGLKPLMPPPPLVKPADAGAVAPAAAALALGVLVGYAALGLAS